jgi:hypothetical protein
MSPVRLCDDRICNDHTHTSAPLVLHPLFPLSCYLDDFFDDNASQEMKFERLPWPRCLYILAHNLCMDICKTSADLPCCCPWSLKHQDTVGDTQRQRETRTHFGYQHQQLITSCGARLLGPFPPQWPNCRTNSRSSVRFSSFLRRSTSKEDGVKETERHREGERERDEGQTETEIVSIDNSLPPAAHAA